MPLTSVPTPTGFGARLRRLIRRPSGNALRAAVLGVNDGLVSSFCLVMGLEGAAATREAVILAGLAGLAAGACSMALGEWLSVTNSREMNNKRLRDMAHDLLLSRRTLERGYFRRDVVERLLTQHSQGVHAWHDQLWNLLMLEMWHRTFIDSPVPGRRSGLTSLAAAG